MKVLIAEDEPNIALSYRIMLEDRGHTVTTTANGEECVKAYAEALSGFHDTSAKYLSSYPPFDAVILDYRMPIMDGMEAAKAILKLNPSQRIIFASAYALATVQESIKNLGIVVELLQKPFDLDFFVSIVEDKSIFEELEKINVDVKALKEVNPTHSQIRDLLAGLKKLPRQTPLIDKL